MLFHKEVLVKLCDSLIRTCYDLLSIRSGTILVFLAQLNSCR